MTIAVAFVGKGASSSNTVTSGSGTTTGGANSVLVVGVSFDAGVSISSVSDNKGNVYTAVGTVLMVSGIAIALYECVGGTGGAGHTATVNFTGTAYPCIHFVEVTGATSSSPRDISVKASSYSDDFSAATGALAQANEVVLALAGSSAGGTLDYRETSAYGFTQLSEEQDGNNYWTSALFGKVVASTSSFTPSFDNEAGSNPVDWVLWLVSYKEAAGGGPPPASMPPLRNQAHRIAPLLGF